MKFAREKSQFKRILKGFEGTLDVGVSATDRQWAVKGFIDAFRNIYTISADTKIVSKILEIHLFPMILEFATNSGYRIVLADHQNYYPISGDKSSLNFSDLFSSCALCLCAKQESNFSHEGTKNTKERLFHVVCSILQYYPFSLR